MIMSQNHVHGIPEDHDRERIRSAVTSKDLASVERLLHESPALATTRTRDGGSLLLLAKYIQADDIARRIAAVRDEFDIFEAAAMGELPHVRRMIEADPESPAHFSPDGFTALHLAVFFRQMSVARLLLANGADVDAAAQNDSVVRPIHSAAATRDSRPVRVILAAGADPNAKQTGGHTALHSAVLHVNMPMVMSLLGAGADPTIRNDEGRSPREQAAETNSGPLMALLRACSEFHVRLNDLE